MKSVVEQTEPMRSVVVVIDDDRLFRRSITRLLETHGYETEAYQSLNEISAAGRIPQMGCALLDLNLPDTNGLEIQDKLAIIAPALSIVFLTGFGRVASSVRAMKTGAVDFLEKPVDDAILIQAVERAIDRSKRLSKERVEREELLRRFGRLTVREREVFVLITAGLLNKQAGAELAITEKTVKVHRAHVMEKMEVQSLAELVRVAQRLGPDVQFAAPSSNSATGSESARTAARGR